MTYARLWISSCFLALGLAFEYADVTLVAAPQAPSTQKPPAAAAARPANERGAELFKMTCKVCHGEAGIGGVGPALRGTKFTRSYVHKAMAEGRPGTMMPQFSKTFSATQINDVATYVSSLQTPASMEPSGGLRGDASAGEAVFFSRGARSCYVCHTYAGRGGNVGPELTSRVAGLTPKELFQRIIVVPHRSTDPAYATTKLTTRVGMIITGIKAGETDDVVQFYDTSSLPPTLRTIAKKDIVSTEAQGSQSVMPSDYASRLTLQQLLDIVSFLKSPAGGPRVSVTLNEVVR